MLIDEIEQIRSRIDSIDKDILNLLAERQECAIKIGYLKDELRKTSSSKKIGAYDPTRENAIIENLRKQSSELPSDGVEAVFREIMSLCRNSAHKTTVFFIKDSIEIERAALSLLGRSCNYCACNNKEEFLTKLTTNEFNIGLLEEAQTSKAIIEKLLLSGFEIKTSFMIQNNFQTNSSGKVNLIIHT